MTVDTAGSVLCQSLFCPVSRRYEKKNCLILAAYTISYLAILAVGGSWEGGTRNRRSVVFILLLKDTSQRKLVFSPV